ncbi:type II secretion system protein J [Marinobacter halophilus]|nr:type II secretion system protein J [Marinobacter halophilus]
MPAADYPSVKCSGFTLMEVLIAVTITAFIGLGVWQVINSVVNSKDRVNQVAGEFENLQKTMLFLERDLTQLINRPVRDLYGDFQPALNSREDAFVLALTRQGWRNPLGLRRSGLQRVAWEYTGTELRRRYWPTVDQGQDDNSRDLLMLDGVLSFEIRFLTSEFTWQDQWPADQDLANLLPGARPILPMPRGIEVTLEHEKFGELVRTFALADFDVAEAQATVNRQIEASSESDTDNEEGQEQQDTGT